MKNRLVLIVTAALSLMTLGLSAASAQVPQQISFAGRLTDLNRNVLDGTFSIVFSIYDASSGGNLLWTETQPAVTVTNGAVQTKLGAVTPIPYTVGNAANAYLQIQVGTDVLSPRQPLLSTLYAYSANNLGGIPFTAYVDTITTQNVGGVKTFISTVTAPGFVGSGTALTGVTAVSVPASGITAGTLGGGVIASSLAASVPLPDAQLSANVSLLASTQTVTAQKTFSNTVTVSTTLVVGSYATFLSSVNASGFFGNGAGITGVTASSIAAANISAGSLGAGVIASSIAATVAFPDSQLSANVSLLNSTQTATANKAFASTVTVNALTVGGDARFGSGTLISTASAGNLTLPGTVTATSFVGDGSTLSNIVTNPMGSTLVMNSSPAFNTSTKIGIVVTTNVFVDGKPVTANNGTRDSSLLYLRAHYDSQPGGGTTDSPYDFALVHVMDSLSSNVPATHLAIRDNAGEDLVSVLSTGEVDISSGAALSSFVMGNLTVPGTVAAANFTGDGSTLSGIVTNPLTTSLILNSTTSLRTSTRAALTVATHTYVTAVPPSSGFGNGSFLSSPNLGLRGYYHTGGQTLTYDFRLIHVMESASPSGHLAVTDDHGNEVLTILDSDRGGNIGIGASTSTPAALLTISSATAAASDVLLQVSSGDAVSQTMLRVTGSGTVVIGTAPVNTAVRLQVTGKLRLVDGTQANGRILTSDANGNASWTAPTGVQLSSTQTFTGQDTFSNLVTVSSSVIVTSSVTAAEFVGDGSFLTNVSSLAATVPILDSELSANVGLLAGAQTYSGLKTFSAPLTVVSSMSVTGNLGSGGSLRPACKTAAQLQGMTPLDAGEVYCDSSDGFQWYVATGTAMGQWAALGRPTVGP